MECLEKKFIAKHSNWQPLYPIFLEIMIRDMTANKLTEGCAVKGTLCFYN